MLEWRAIRLFKGLRWRLRKHALSIWKILFALLAVADLCTCWPLLRQGWNSEASTTSDDGDDVVFCSTSDGVCYVHVGSILSTHFHRVIGSLFVVACLVEAAIRAQQARVLAMEMHALDIFEEHLRHASSRVSLTVQPDMFARSTVRSYIPVITVVSFWITLLPRASLASCENDESLTTMWFMISMEVFAVYAEHIQAILATFVWKSVMPYKAFQPKRFVGRLRLIMRGIRYVRFAGPFFRMGLKLFDQFNALAKTWRYVTSSLSS